MKYSVVITSPMILSANTYSAIQQGYRVEKKVDHTFDSMLSKNDAIVLYDSLSIQDYPRRDIIDQNNLSVVTCHVSDNYETNIIENHKGRA